MTLKELKEEARRQGYYLVKAENPYEKLKPCVICGNNRRDHFKTKDAKVAMRCTKCGFTVLGTSERAIHKKWNEECSKPKPEALQSL